MHIAKQLLLDVRVDAIEHRDLVGRTDHRAFGAGTVVAQSLLATADEVIE